MQCIGEIANRTDQQAIVACAPEQAVRKSINLRRSVFFLKSRTQSWKLFKRDHLASGRRIALDPLVSQQRNPIRRRNNQNWVRDDSYLVDGGRIDVVDVIAST